MFKCCFLVTVVALKLPRPFFITSLVLEQICFFDLTFWFSLKNFQLTTTIFYTSVKYQIPIVFKRFADLS